MQAALSEQRAAEAAIERQRTVHGAHGEALSAVQARYYEVGADISRLEQSIEHTRELRERQRADLTQTHATLGELATHIGRDEQQLTAVRAELAELAPQLQAAQEAESEAAGAHEAAERAVHDWQQRWEAHTRAIGAAEQVSGVERARIEQLENQLRRLSAQAQRLGEEHESLSASHPDSELTQLCAEEAAARARSEEVARALNGAHEQVQALRATQLAAERELEATRGARETARAELTSLEALQAAALSDHAGQTAQWLSAAGLAGRPRLAAALEVEGGWERAVETVLGDYLEAVCVEELDAAAGSLGGLSAGRLTLIEGSAGGEAAAAGTLAARVRGPGAILARLAGVFTAPSLAQALQQRAALGDGHSYITAAGEWVGRAWLRVSRGSDERAGVLEREHRLKVLRGSATAAGTRVTQAQAALAAARAGLAAAESERESTQQGLQLAHRTHADQLAALQGARARAAESQQRGERLRADAGEVQRERAATEQALARAREELARAAQTLASLEGQHGELTREREARRAALASARAHAQTLQLSARDLHVRVESRRSTESSVAVGMGRMIEQRTQLLRRREELETELASGDAPILQAQARLDEALALRLTVEGELAGARTALEAAEAGLRAFDEERLNAEQRVSVAREAMEAARLAAQETHVRRAALAEQFAETRCELSAVLAGLTAAADVPAWEQSLSEARADVEKLGQVNLAAIDELKEQTQRKEYLDRQFADLNSTR